MQPQEGGQEGLGAAGPRAVPLRLRPPRLRHRSGGGAHGDGARLHQVGEGQGGKEGQGRVLRTHQHGEMSEYFAIGRNRFFTFYPSGQEMVNVVVFVVIAVAVAVAPVTVAVVVAAAIVVVVAVVAFVVVAFVAIVVVVKNKCKIYLKMTSRTDRYLLSHWNLQQKQVVASFGFSLSEHGQVPDLPRHGVRGQRAHADPPLQGPHLRHPPLEGQARAGRGKDQAQEAGGGARQEGRPASHQV